MLNTCSVVRAHRQVARGYFEGVFVLRRSSKR